MKCANYLCVYSSNGECVLEDISLDISGICESCILISIPKDDLKKYKEEVLKRLDDDIES